MTNFKIWIMVITIKLWKRKIRILTDQITQAETKLCQCEDIFQQLNKESTNE